MIPVDLNRLREARTRFEMPRNDEVELAASAVLDAPTVWWCAMPGVHQPDWNIVKCRLSEHEGCGWVALVPVKGRPGMSEITLDDLRVCIGHPDYRDLTPAEFDRIATEQGYVKRPACGECKGSGCAVFPAGFVHSHSGADRHRPCPSCGGTGFGRLVALDGIDTDELRQGIEYHRKDCHSDPTLIQRYLALARQVLDALDGGQE